MVSDVTLGSDPFGDAVPASRSRRVKPFVTLRPALPAAGEIAAEVVRHVSGDVMLLTSYLAARPERLLVH